MAKSKKSLSNLIYWVILIVLVAGLAGFGVTNFGRTVHDVGSVGDTKIDANLYGRALQAAANRINSQTGQTLTGEQLRSMGLGEQVLQQQITLASLEEAARRAGLSVGDKAVADQVTQIAAFQGADGKFDASAYKSALQRAGMSVGSFESSLRREESSRLLQSVLLTGLTPPEAYGQALLRYVSESRAGAVAQIDPGQMDNWPPHPTDDQIQAYYKAHPEQFTAPASRKITYAWLTPDMLAAKLTLSDKDLHALYDSEADTYQKPEQRMVERLGFSDMAAAQKAKAEIDAGTKTFDQLVKERGLKETDVDLGTIAQSDLGDEAGKTVFGLKDTGVAGPVMSAVGPALFKVNAILAAKTTSYEQALPALKKELGEKEAKNQIANQLDDLNDKLAGGATLEDLAKETDLQLGTDVWSSEDPGDAPIAKLPEFGAAAAKISKSDFPVIETASDGSVFAIRLDDEVPATLRPIDDVRENVISDLVDDMETKALTELGNQALAELKAGKSFDDAGLVPQAFSGVSRRTPAANMPQEVTDAIFKMKPGEVQLVAGKAGVFIVKLDGTTPPDISTPESKQILSTVQSQAVQAMAQDVVSQFAAAAASDAGIHLNQDALTAVQNAALK